MSGRYKEPGLRDPETGEVDTREVLHRAKGWIAVLVSLVVLGGGLWWGGTKAFNAWNEFRQRDDYAGSTGVADVEVTIAKGSSMAKIGETLQAAGVVKDAKTFYKVATGRPDDVKKIQAGKFKMRTQISSDAAMDILRDPGRLIRNLMRLPEGQRLSQQVDVMSKAAKLPAADVEAALKNGKELGLPAWAGGKAEGFLFPDTYEIPDAPTAPGVAKLPVTQFTKIATEMDFVNRAKASPAQDPYRALIVASIIEREVFRDEDRAKVARVLYNRLEKKMKLELDSTVAYAVGKTGTVWTTPAERATDSPYNMYLDKNAGKLPPGPITSPSRKALEAAVAPEDGTWLFFVPVNLDSGETKFTSTLEEHNAAVAELQAWCTASPENRKKCA